MCCTAYHTEIVESESFVHGYEDVDEDTSVSLHLFAVHFDRVHVNYKRHVEDFGDFTLCVVNLVVSFEDVTVGWHFHMSRAHHSAWAVVVDNHIVDTDADRIVVENSMDFIDDFSVRHTTEERLESFHCNFIACVENEKTYEETEPAVDVYAENLCNNHTDCSCRCGNTVALAVCFSRDKACGVDFSADVAVEIAHPELYSDGRHKTDNNKPVEFDWLRCDYFGNRRFDDFDTDEDNENCNKQTCEIFISAVTERMVFVSRL